MVKCSVVKEMSLSNELFMTNTGRVSFGMGGGKGGIPSPPLDPKCPPWDLGGKKH